MLEFANNFGKGLIYKGLAKDFVIATTFFSGKQSVGNGALSLRPLFSGKQSVGNDALSLRPRFLVGSNLLEMVLCHCDHFFSGKQSVGMTKWSLKSFPHKLTDCFLRKKA